MAALDEERKPASDPRDGRRVTDVVVDALTDSLDESNLSRVIDEHAGNIVVMPARTFDPEEIPDVDLGPFLVEHEGEGRVPIPRYLPESFKGGLHVVAPHHVAMIWSDMRVEQLRKEVQLREEHDLPIPAVARQRLDREVYR